MGTHCSSELHRGHIQVKKTTTMKLLLLTALAAVSMAEPEADAHYGYYGYGYHPGFYGYVPYGYYGLHRVYYGLPLGAGVAGHPGAATSYSHRSPQGLRGKRSAEEDAAPAEAEAAPVAA